MNDIQHSERRRRRFEAAPEAAPEPAAPSAAEPAAPEAVPEPAAPSAAEPAGSEPTGEWLLIDEIALSGRPVVVRAFLPLVSNGGNTGEAIGPDSGVLIEAEAVYRNSRRFNGVTLKWEGHGFWALRNASGSKLPFEPSYYRILE